MKIIIVTILLALATTANAAGVIVDFEELLPNTDPTALPGPIVSKGFSFATENGFLVAAASGPSQSLYYCPYCTLTIADDSGAAFRLNQFDLSEPGASSGTFTITGHLAGGGTVSTTAPASSLARTVKFDETWDGLDHVIISDGSTDSFGRGIDNVILNAVPIPAAVWLFGSGLGVLGWLRRRRA